MSDIFLSYSSIDRSKAKTLVRVLEKQGWTVWWDRLITAGNVWDERVSSELKAARCVVVLWSEHSIQSNWVRTEAHEAMNRKILVPAMLQDIEIPLGFRLIQTHRLADWGGETDGAEISGLLAAITGILSPEASPVQESLTIRDRMTRLAMALIRKRTAWPVAFTGGILLACILLVTGYLLAIHPVFGSAAALGLKRIEKGKYDTDENERLGYRIRNANHSIKLLMPNASHIAQDFREDFAHFLENPGTSMQVIFATPESDFYAEMTHQTLGGKWTPKELAENKAAVSQSRRRLLDAAKNYPNRVQIRYFDTQFKLPVILIDDDYCIVTLRLPPNEGGESPRLEFEGETGFVQTCKGHFQNTWNDSCESDDPLSPACQKVRATLKLQPLPLPQPSPSHP